MLLAFEFFGASSKTVLYGASFVVFSYVKAYTVCVNLALPCLRGQQVDKELGWGNVSLWASE